jgi:dephospho-CoA kinase
MIRLGLTGGIACGKSTASSVFQSLGVPVLDADQVARDVVSLGSVGLSEIVQHFGTDVLHSDGTLHREALRNIIIQDSSAKQTLEQITHPKIFQHMSEWQQHHAEGGTPVTIVDAALMVETGSYKIYDALIVVSCDPETQESRLMARNAIDRQTAIAWINSQMPLSEKVKLADWNIENNDSIETLQHHIVEHWPQFLSQVQQRHTRH